MRLVIAIETVVLLALTLQQDQQKPRGGVGRREECKNQCRRRLENLARVTCLINVCFFLTVTMIGLG